MAADILARIKADYPFLSRVETKIARLLLENPAAFINYTVTELAGTAGVSQGSINNFAGKFCGGGFARLKLEIAAAITHQPPVPFALTDASQSLKAALEVKINDTLLACRSTVELNSEDTLQRVATRLRQAKKIEIYGVLTSAIVAQDLCFQLIQLGLPASYLSDSLMSAVSASLLDENCLIVAISTSGSTKEVLDTVEIAKQHRVPVVCLTANGSSPLAQLSDDVLLTAAGNPTVSDHARQVRFSQLLLADTLCAYLCSVMDTDSHEQYYKLEQILNSHSVD